MVSCKSCKKKDKREYADDCFACDNGDQWEAKRHRSPNKPQTNADRIRAMSDEELAEFMRPWDSGCPRWKENPLPCSDWDNCGECWLKWLKEEVKDG